MGIKTGLKRIVGSNGRPARGQHSNKNITKNTVEESLNKLEKLASQVQNAGDSNETLANIEKCLDGLEKLASQAQGRKIGIGSARLRKPKRKTNPEQSVFEA